MSCIRFNSPAQRRAMRDMAPSMLTADQVAELHPAPQITDSKIQRLRLLAEHHNPKIRESVASSGHTPEDVLARLARDPDEGVRGWLARNESAPCDVLRSLAADESETVRGWLALNFFVPEDVMSALASDTSETVRSLVAWKTQLAAG